MAIKVIVIGAGPAGLTAAHELLRESGYDVTVLEATDAIGGISQTVRVGGNRMDIGGHRFFSKDKRVTEWWEKLMPTQGAPSIDDKILGRDKDYSEGGPDPEQTDRVMLLRERVSRIYYRHAFFNYPVTLSLDTIKNMGFITTVKAGFSYLASVFHKRPETSLENFYINRFGKVLYSMFFEGYTEKLWGRHPSEISADWGAQRVKGLSIAAVIKDIFRKIIPTKKEHKVETSLIERFIYPKYGPGQLWELAADEVKRLGGEILMGAEVIGISAVNGEIKSVDYIYNGDRVTLEGDIFISTMPVCDLIADMNGDAVPENIATAAAGLPYRDFVTVGLLVNKLNLVNKTGKKTLGDIVPDCWIYVQDTGVKLGRIQIFNNWSPYMVEDPQNTVWIGLEYFCREGDEFWNMSDDETIALATRELISMGVIDEDDVLASHRERIKKAYPAYFDTYDQMNEIIAYLNGYANLYCIGRNGQHRYNNMDHSMATAFEAVDNIKNGVTDKSNIWSVNTEQEYHEEDKK